MTQHIKAAVLGKVHMSWISSLVGQQDIPLLWDIYAEAV